MEFTQQTANEFSTAWINAWNAHDIEAVLKHYTEDFEIITPMAEKILGPGNRSVRGKENVRIYWQKGLQLIPDLHFKLLEVFVGIESLAIYYQNTATNTKVVENLFFNKGGDVYKSVVMYSSEN
jgi:hypothetical protein